MRVKLRCPNCQQLLMVREEEVGATRRCPGCKQEVELKPAARSAKAQAAPVAVATPVAEEALPVAELVDIPAPTTARPANTDHSSAAGAPGPE